MSKVSCECGHINPEGTEICESCGKPLQHENKQVLNMRYEGVARRSQTYNKSIVDKIWNFFSSVKVGVWIIVLTLLASSLGTIFPQELFIPPNVDPAAHYAQEYGVAGKVYYTLGFHNLYGSWWYMGLIAALGTSLIIASIDRVVPLYRALKTQRVTRHTGFMKRQRLYGTSQPENVDETMAEAKELLKSKRYNIREENGNLVAEKNRFSRWGPYVNHLGLIIFLLGAMLRFFPGMYVDENVWVRDGETVVLPGTDGEYYLENEEFVLELYDEEDERFVESMARTSDPVVETFQTNAVLYEREQGDTIGVDGELTRIDEHPIEVNDPLTFDNFSVYQVDYKLNEFSDMSFELTNRETDEAVGQIDIDLFDPEDTYELDDGYAVDIHSYFPDFFFTDDGDPSTRSSVPDNPAFIFEMSGPDLEEPEISFVGIQQNMDVNGDNQYGMNFADLDTNHVTALTVRKDLTLPFLIVGGSIFMIGLIQGSYWAHRRIWLQRGEDGSVHLAGHTNKNWQSLKRDFEALSNQTELQVPADQIEEKEKKEEAEKENETSSRNEKE
ncbi:cytochrome c biogenesis protein ResB [Salsuginibacillus kocurii]|uniref:cytochrome c biogenesis protein ResB n=1 Tax=Salsuginibacillus kocurii TaxID=427078 RepID=UPI000360597D|nr:cytochrome c biogenesis protein ResB [Salsuginibacillus kocurii]